MFLFLILGAGHGGRGGRGSAVNKTGTAYGELFSPVDVGCRGGDGSKKNSGGRGGGVVYLRVTGVMQINGRVSCNGEDGHAGGGGGSGGSINIHANLIKVKYQLWQSY